MNKTEITDPIATEELLWVKKDGEEIFITAKVGRPYKIDNHVWACPSELIGVDNKYLNMHGVGSMQALGLAMALIKTRLGHLLASVASMQRSEIEGKYVKCPRLRCTASRLLLYSPLRTACRCERLMSNVRVLVKPLPCKPHGYCLAGQFILVLFSLCFGV